MMKPSPPKKPEPSFFWKVTDRVTDSSAARNPLFWTMISRPGAMVKARMLPGKLEAKAIMPGPPWAV